MAGENKKGAQATQRLPSLNKTAALLSAAGITQGKFRNKSYRMPLILLHARERDYSAISSATLPIHNPAEMEIKKNEVIQQRMAKGVHWRAMAKKLGHSETDGKFQWENTRIPNQSIPACCMLCGHSNHDVEGCIHFLQSYKLKNKKPYVSGAVSWVAQDDETPPPPLPEVHYSNHFSFSGTVFGYAAVDPETGAVTFRVQFDKGAFKGLLGEFNIAGKEFTTEHGFVSEKLDVEGMPQQTNDENYL